jgi:tetrapyrrole methylase family protein/MazG family protein
LPPLDRAFKLQKKAAKKGFDWPNAEGVFDKLDEELDEVKEALNAEGNPFRGSPGDPKRPDKVEEELGDLLFSAVNLCRFLKVEPSVALQRTNAKFTERFKYVERKMKETGKTMEAANLALMDSFWDEAKAAFMPGKNAAAH